MAERPPNFIFGAIYRSRSGRAEASHQHPPTRPEALTYRIPIGDIHHFYRPSFGISLTGASAPRRRRCSPGQRRRPTLPNPCPAIPACAGGSGIRPRGREAGGGVVKRDVHEAVTERFIEQLERGTVPWRKPWLGVQNIVSRDPTAESTRSSSARRITNPSSESLCNSRSTLAGTSGSGKNPSP